MALANDAAAQSKWENVERWFFARTYRPFDYEGKRLLELLGDVNESVNHDYDYRRDAKDKWLNPDEFLARGGGDCEDFAIAKMHMLAKRGLALDRMEVWVITRGRSTILVHAVLVVDGWAVLDNFEDDIYNVDRLRETNRPRYAVGVGSGRRLDGKP